MHIAVFVKQVPEQNSVKINPDNTIDASGINPIINLFDEYAIEEGLQWAEKLNGNVTVISIGPEEATDSLKKALAMGANDAVLVSDAATSNIDGQGAARVAAAAIKKLGNIDMIICGKQSTDDETGEFGPALARFLGWPQLTYVFKIHEIDTSAQRIVADRALENTLESVESTLPAVITVVKDINEPRYPSLLKIRKVAKTPIPSWSLSDLGLSPEEVRGQVIIEQRTPPPPRPRGTLIEGADTAEKVRKLVDKLVESQVL